MDIFPKEIQDPKTVRRLLFAVSYLPEDIPQYWAILSDFVCKDLSKPLSASDLQTAVDNLKFLYEVAGFASDIELATEIQSLPLNTAGATNPIGIILISKNNKCKKCDSKLLVRGDRPSRVTVYTEIFGTVPGTHYRKFCSNSRKGCNFTQHYGYSADGSLSGVVYDDDWRAAKYFVSTSETAFELSFLEKYDADLLIGQVSYSQKAEIYNFTHGYPVQPKTCTTLDKDEKPLPKPRNTEDLCKRIRLDRRRLENAHLKYAVLCVSETFPELKELAIFTPDISDTLQKFTPEFYRAFCQKHGGHLCTYPGCREVLIIDGNMKNRRDICAAKDAGWIQYPELPGCVKTGCISSPAFKSAFCAKHKIRAVEADTADPDKMVVDSLLAKKETRNGNYYQVLWLGRATVHVTWEPEGRLPPAIVQEFETGQKVDTVQNTALLYGTLNTTLVSSATGDMSPPTKKARTESGVVMEKNTGVFVDDRSTVPLACNTEKDKQFRLHSRTAGILAGIRPCGTIVLLSELFVSESKSQVYGCLHNYFEQLPHVANRTDIVCYDDACHLKKYCMNPVRQFTTQNTKKLGSMKMVVDKMHMRGHTDVWCKQNCDPSNVPALEKVDSEVCEQTFSWLSRYSRITQKMSQHTFLFYLLYLCELHNNRESEKLSAAGFL